MTECKRGRSENLWEKMNESNGKTHLEWLWEGGFTCNNLTTLKNEYLENYKGINNILTLLWLSIILLINIISSCVCQQNIFPALIIPDSGRFQMWSSISVSICVLADTVWFIYRYPTFHSIAKEYETNSGEVLVIFCCIFIGPSAQILKRLRQVPVIQCYLSWEKWR